MQECLTDLVPPAALRNPDDIWWTNIKASDDLLDRLFEMFFARLNLPNLLRKTDYHVLARHVPPSRISPEVHDVLDLIQGVAARAKPAAGSA
jgi:hypothetical protein